MQRLLVETKAMFDTFEKWDVFLELCKLKREIVEDWYSALFVGMKNRFLKDDIVAGWSFNAKTYNTYVWYLSKYGPLSIGIWFEGCFQLNMWADANTCNLDKTKELLNTDPCFQPILTAFGNIDGRFVDGYIVKGNLSWELEGYYGRPEEERLAYYAYKETDHMIAQVSTIIDRFRKDERVTALLEKLNEEAKK